MNVERTSKVELHLIVGLFNVVSRGALTHLNPELQTASRNVIGHVGPGVTGQPHARDHCAAARISQFCASVGMGAVKAAYMASDWGSLGRLDPDQIIPNCLRSDTISPRDEAIWVFVLGVERTSSGV